MCVFATCWFCRANEAPKVLWTTQIATCQQFARRNRIDGWQKRTSVELTTPKRITIVEKGWFVRIPRWIHWQHSLLAFTPRGNVSRGSFLRNTSATSAVSHCASDIAVDWLEWKHIKRNHFLTNLDILVLFCRPVHAVVVWYHTGKADVRQILMLDSRLRLQKFKISSPPKTIQNVSAGRLRVLFSRPYSFWGTTVDFPHRSILIPHVASVAWLVNCLCFTNLLLVSSSFNQPSCLWISLL